MTDAQIIAVVQNYLNSLATVRVPELPPYSVNGDLLTLDDKLPVWRAETNKTVRTTLLELKALLISQDNTVLTPDKIGSSIVVIAGIDQIGTDTFNIPSLAGKSFLLRKVGFGTLKFDDPNKQYEMLSAGGFKLLQGAIIQENDQFELQLVDGTTNQLLSSGSNLFSGTVIVSSSITLNASNHIGKLIQLRPAAASVVVTMPDIDDVEEDTVVVFESMINCAHEVKINTTGGQYIYFNGTSHLQIFLRKGEFLWLYRGADGWYVLNASNSISHVGSILDGYDTQINELELVGQQLSIASYPRLWEWVSGLSNSIVDEATWAIESVYLKDGVWSTVAPSAPYKTIPFPYRGCFAHDASSDFFRLPDFTDMSVRSLGTVDTERFHNHPGGYQHDDIRAHSHSYTGERLESFSGTGSGFGGDGGTLAGDAKITNEFGGVETRVKNIGLIKKIKV